MKSLSPTLTTPKKKLSAQLPATHMTSRRGSRSPRSLLFTFCLLLSLRVASASILSVEDFGAVPNDEAANTTNREAFNLALAAAQDGDTVLVEGGVTWHLVGGVLGIGLRGVTLQLDGVLNFLPDLGKNPTRTKDELQPTCYGVWAPHILT